MTTIKELGWKEFDRILIQKNFITRFYPSDRTCRFLYRIVEGGKVVPENYKITREEKEHVAYCFSIGDFPYMEICNLIVEKLKPSDLVLRGQQRAAGYCYVACEAFYWMCGVKRHKWFPLLEDCGSYNHWTIYNESEHIYIDFPGNKSCLYYQPATIQYIKKI